MIPIPDVDHPICQIVMNLVDKIQNLSPDSRDFETLNMEINRHIYQLYCLTNEEISIIEQ